MTLRRYAPMKPSGGTRIPDAVRRQVVLRDAGCVGPRIGMPDACTLGIELDHVRGSGALGRKSETSPSNLASLCNRHHRIKTLEGRRWRPALLQYLAGQ